MKVATAIPAIRATPTEPPVATIATVAVATAGSYVGSAQWRKVGEYYDACKARAHVAPVAWKELKALIFDHEKAACQSNVAGIAWRVQHVGRMSSLARELDGGAPQAGDCACDECSARALSPQSRPPAIAGEPSLDDDDRELEGRELYESVAGFVDDAPR